LPEHKPDVISAVFAMLMTLQSTFESGKIAAAQRTDVEGQRRFKILLVRCRGKLCEDWARILIMAVVAVAALFIAKSGGLRFTFPKTWCVRCAVP
jgi:hypothetical protein